MEHADAAVVDATSDDWASQACDRLRRRGYARLRLSPDDAAIVRQMLGSAATFFRDEAAKDESRVGKGADPDTRSGYLQAAGREELVVVAGTVLLGTGGYRDAVNQFVDSPFSAGESWAVVLRQALSASAG